MSSAFHYLADLVREHGLTLLVGTTVLLCMFSLLVRYSRSLSTKNLLASTAMLAVFGYLIVATVPMPRFGIDFNSSATTSIDGATAESARIAAGQQMLAALQQPSSKQLDAITTTPNAIGPNAIGPIEASSIEKGPVEIGQIAPPMPSRTERLDAALRSLEPLPQTSHAFDPARWIAAVLTLGAFVFAAHLLLGWLRLRHLLQQSQSAPTELTGLVELPARTSLRIVNARVQPFCCGLLRPTIVLPRKLAHPTDETRFILLHERAHLTSGDTRARLLSALLRPLLFWHPLYWWLQRQLRFTSELLADDAAAQGSVAEYVRCMMTLSTHPDPATGGALVATIFRRRSELFRRLEMMLQRDEAISRSHSPMSRFARAASTLLLIALCAGTFGVERAVAQSPGNEKVQTQVRALKAELDRLRREIIALRDAEKANPQPERRIRIQHPETEAPNVDPVAGERPRRNLFGNPIAPAADSANRNQQDPVSQPAPRASSNRRMLYKVQSGDTLAKIARKFLGSSRKASEIQRCNPKLQPNRLRVGQQLTIPLPSTRGAVAPFAESPARRAPRGLPGMADEPRPSNFGNPGRRPPTARAPRAAQDRGDARLPTARAPRAAQDRGDARLPTARAPRAARDRGDARLPTARAPRTPRDRGDALPPGAAAPQSPAFPEPARVDAPELPGSSSHNYGGYPPTAQTPRAVRNNRRPPSPPGPSVPRGSRRAGPGISGPGSAGPAGPSSSGPSAAGPSSSGPGSSGPSASGRVATGASTPGADPRRRAPAGPSYPSAGSGAAGATASPTASAPRTSPRAGLARKPRAADNNRSTAPTSLSSLADLVTRYIELRGDVEIQEVNVQHAQSEKESKIAQIRLRTKKSQFKAIQGMLKQELRAAEQAHAYSKKLHENGFVTAAEVQATESKIVLLARALQ